MRRRCMNFMEGIKACLIIALTIYRKEPCLDGERSKYMGAKGCMFVINVVIVMYAWERGAWLFITGSSVHFFC